jgi:hypothetical protein
MTTVRIQVYWKPQAFGSVSTMLEPSWLLNVSMEPTNMIPFIDGHKSVQADPYSSKPHASSSGRDVVMDKHVFVLGRKGLRDS